MAMADYVKCAQCGRKAIYDGDIDWGDRWQGGVGDFAALCSDCETTHYLRVVERPAATPAALQSTGGGERNDG